MDIPGDRDERKPVSEPALDEDDLELDDHADITEEEEKRANGA